MAQRPGMNTKTGEHPIEGAMLEVGKPAPDFQLVANDMSTVKTLADYDGKVKIISCVPSLDTRVCAIQTRRFNQEAASLSGDIVILTVSADLPYAQRRWCGAEGIDKVETLSAHRTMETFARDYGVYDTLWRITQRAVFVLDKNNVVRHAEYVYEMGSEPDYEAALESAKQFV